MNAGFSNLEWLKAQLLTVDLAHDKSYDAKILATGLGTAAAIERFCNRKFCDEAGIQETFTAARSAWWTERPIVTEFTKVELRYFSADAWADISGQPVSTNEAQGYINFGYILGRDPMMVRLTYNGGFWWNTLESTDQGYVNPQSPGFNILNQLPAEIVNNPAGIAPQKFLLPEALRFAWLMQCQANWAAVDKTGAKLLETGGTELPALGIIPEVAAILQTYKRYNLT